MSEPPPLPALIPQTPGTQPPPDGLLIHPDGPQPGAPTDRVGPGQSGEDLTLDPGGPQIGHPQNYGVTYAFGDVPVGSTSDRLDIEVRNDLGYDIDVLEIGPAAVAGPGDFTITENGCAGAALAPAGTCFVSIAFVPAGTGPSEASVRLRLRHVCTSGEYWPCRWQPAPGDDPSGRNFERHELPDGSVAFE